MSAKNSYLEEKDFSELEAQLGVSFDDKELLTQAFIHRSYINENKESQLAHNERLEFLGDRVVGLVLAEALFESDLQSGHLESPPYHQAVEGLKWIYRAKVEKVIRFFLHNGYRMDRAE